MYSVETYKKEKTTVEVADSFLENVHAGCFVAVFL